MTPETRRVVGFLALAVGLVLLAVAIVYFAVPAKSLPSFMGQISGETVHRNKRAVASLVLAIGSLGLSAFLLVPRRAGPS